MFRSAPLRLQFLAVFSIIWNLAVAMAWLVRSSITLETVFMLALRMVWPFFWLYLILARWKPAWTLTYYGALFWLGLLILDYFTGIPSVEHAITLLLILITLFAVGSVESKDYLASKSVSMENRNSGGRLLVGIIAVLGALFVFGLVASGKVNKWWVRLTFPYKSFTYTITDLRMDANGANSHVHVSRTSKISRIEYNEEVHIPVRYQGCAEALQPIFDIVYSESVSRTSSTRHREYPLTISNIVLKSEITATYEEEYRTHGQFMFDAGCESYEIGDLYVTVQPFSGPPGKTYKQTIGRAFRAPTRVGP